jgi:acetyl esterase/lipase
MHWTQLARPLSFAWPAVDNYFRHLPAVRVSEDLRYTGSGHPKHRLDLFAPAPPREPSRHPRAPVVIFLHGGGWKPQDRRLLRGISGLYGNVGAALARAGILTLVASYRQGADTVVAHQCEDLSALVDWAAARTAEHGGDPRRLVLCGHSFGATVVLLGALGRLAGRSEVRGVVAIGGAYDMERFAGSLSSSDRRRAERFFGDAVSSPERKVHGGMPPLLMITGEKEVASLRDEHAAMRAACEHRGARLTALDVAGAGHMGLVLQMGSRKDEVTPAVARFVHGLDGA